MVDGCYVASTWIIELLYYSLPNMGPVFDTLDFKSPEEGAITALNRVNKAVVLAYSIRPRVSHYHKTQSVMFCKASG